MERADYLKRVRQWVANIAIGPSTLRNQGAPGVNDAARAFLRTLDLMAIKPTRYHETLNEWTGQLLTKLPEGARNWGTARKAINVFMVAAFFNRVLSKEYNLEQLGNVLETPLDSQAAYEMRRRARMKGRRLPRWSTITGLGSESSQQFQAYALELARGLGLCRAELDLVLWRSAKEHSM